MKILYINWIDLLDNFLYNIWFKLWFQILDNSLSCLVFTSQEKKESNILFFTKNIFTFLFWLFLTILTTPVGLLTYIIWFILFRKLFRQQPFKLSVQLNKNSLFVDENSSLKNYIHVNKSFQILSINVCLLPETISRINNLSLSHKRLESIGSLLNKSKSYNNLIDNNFCKNNTNDNNTYDNNITERDTKIKIIHDFFEQTDLDFVCMQEVWSIDTSKKLKNMLHEKFDYILYDAGINTFKLNKYIGFDSGLLIASKYPILDANFACFSVRVGSCWLTSKGLLTAKVYLGKFKNGKDAIGFISNTHLQAYPKKQVMVHSIQLNEIKNWLKNFKEKSFKKNTEVILFDIICGDFNIDNMSPVDKISYEHDFFFNYMDPLSLRPGLDHHAAIGTEMRYYSIYDSYTLTPETFRKALECDRLRRLFILDANIDGEMSSDAAKEMPKLEIDGLPKKLLNHGGNRRVDRILYSKEHEIEMEEYYFITNFTRLTDHIPIAMKFKSKLL